MTLLVDYVQPLSHWLQLHPHWALLITFLISLTESLAIIGSIVPGSVTMTAIGILAGSGIMRIDLTLLAAILGAVAGDSLSYALGYIYSDQLVEIWPFSKYPKVIHYGKEFFAAHGGKSVLIGRFIGPLRSIIPVIAGILHMKQWRFLLANIISAIGWAFLYVLPGVFIGAASQELSAESATWLFLVILAALALIWLLSICIKWLFRKFNIWLTTHLHDFWLRLKKRPSCSWICRVLTPSKERNHYTTASFALTLLVCFILFVINVLLVLHADWISNINLPIHLLMQSVHTVVLEVFFIFCTQLTSIITISTLFIICCCWFLYNKEYSALLYLCVTLLLSSFIALLLNYWVDSPRPTGILVLMPGSSFPNVTLLIATALYSYILFYINSIFVPFTNTLRILLLTILGLSGLGALYLGDHWFTDILGSYLAGASISLFCCLRYRKLSISQTQLKHPGYFMTALFIGLLAASFISTSVNYRTLVYNHSPLHKEFALSSNAWWNQKKPVLPIYRLNRIGKRISILNIQYSGKLQDLEKNLALHGWETIEESFISNLLTWINNQATELRLPLLSQLYENKSPVLIMTNTQSDQALELRVWKSNYILDESNQPLWIGSIHSTTPGQKNTELLDPLSHLFPEQKTILVKKLALPRRTIRPTIFPTAAYIILIKQLND